jgi:hypothetical protein
VLTVPQQFTLPPDTRSVGTGNPPADMNALIDAAAAMGTVFNVLNAAYAGGADPGGGADSTPAFAACMAAATAAHGAEMIIPPGTYNLNTGGLTFTGPIRIRGLGSSIAQGISTGTPAPAVLLTCTGAAGGGTGAANMFQWPGGANGNGVQITNVQTNYSGTGAVFGNTKFNGAYFADMTTLITSAGGQYMTCSGSGGCINMTHERCFIRTSAPVRTKPVISLSATVSAGVSENTWYRCGITNDGLDNTQYMIYYDCSGGGNGYHVADNFQECFFGHAFGGIIQSLSGNGIRLDGIQIWDLQNGYPTSTTTVAAGSTGGTISGIAGWANPSPGVLSVASTTGFPAGGGRLNIATSGTAAVVLYTGISGNTFTGCTFVSGSGTVSTGGAISGFGTMGANSLFYHGAFAGGPGSQGIQMINCTRQQNADFLDGVRCWDVYCESTTSGIKIDSYVVEPAGTSVYTPAYFNFNGCNDAIVIGTTVPRGSAVNGNSNTVITNPAVSQVTLIGGQVTATQGIGSYSSNQWRPQDMGYVTWAYDPSPLGFGTGFVLTSGTPFIVNCWLRDAPATITGVDLFLTTLGVTLTAGDNLIGLYNQAGTLIGFSADQTAVWNSGAARVVSAGLTAQSGGSLTLVPAGMLRVLVLAVGTTPPGFARGSNVAGRLANGTFTGAASRFGTYGVAAPYTALPASLTPASITAASQTVWAAIY